MADKGKFDEKKPIEYTSPLFLAPSYSPGATPLSSSLAGDNYATSVKATRRALRAKHKLGFIDRTLEKPDPSTEDLNSWDIRDNMIA